MRHLGFLLLIVLLTTLKAVAQISGSSYLVCEGSTTGLVGSPIGGVWTTASTTTATVDASGNVTGIAAGTTTVSYTVLSTTYTAAITVNALPAPITGSPLGICVGSTVTLSCATPGGTWMSGDLGLATVGSASGIVTGLTAGAASVSISYVAPNTCSRYVNVTVNPNPSSISGSSTVCAGSNVSLSDAAPGGTWATSNAAIATVGGAGLVSGVSGGVANITYQFGSGCYAVRTMTVNTIPAPITGPANVCTGSTATLTSASTGGTWSASGPYFTINSVTGVVTGVTVGGGTVTYALSSTGCNTFRTMSVNATPAAITGTATVCPGLTTTLGNTVSGGIWVSDATSVASVSSGISSTTTVTGISGGVANISYITGPGCITTQAVTVHPSPSAGTISGSTLVCTGSSMVLSSTVSGGYWTSTTPSIATVSIGGTVNGIAVGATLITYAVTTICGTDFATYAVTVSPTPTVIAGVPVMCAGNTTTLSNGVAGGTWSSTATSVATVGAGSGVVSGVTAGTSTISYFLGGGCLVTRVITVNLAPGTITGADSVCVGSTTGLSNPVAGGIWNSSNPAIAIVSTIGTSTGVVTGMAAGTSTISYSIVSCLSTMTVTVNGLPSISATAVADACGGGYSLSATGGDTYIWSPSTGLSCAGCASTSVTPTATTTYTVTGVDIAGCTDNATVTINGNRIFGHITFSLAVPTVPNLKVWLVKYNPSDSSITSTDSMLTCLDGSVPYFQFDSKPTGNYMVKAKLLSSMPGTSDYIPTYGGGTPNWYAAASIAHTVNADMQDINMMFGMVPAGPGFISGYVYSGAGKGTSGTIPEAGMIVYLKDAISGQVLTYAYTDASGGYSFSGIGFGNYIVSPEEFDYYTTPSATITLSTTSFTTTDVTFKKNTSLHTIYPYVASGVGSIYQSANGITVFPNPANGYVNISWPFQQQGTADVTITDMAGRVLISNQQKMGNTSSKLEISMLDAGIYFISIQSAGVQYSNKLAVTK